MERGSGLCVWVVELPEEGPLRKRDMPFAGMEGWEGCGGVWVPGVPVAEMEDRRGWRFWWERRERSRDVMASASSGWEGCCGRCGWTRRGSGGLVVEVLDVGESGGESGGDWMP